MILGEPPRSAYDLHFRLFGIPIRVHPFFWLLCVLLMANRLLHASNVRDFLFLLVPWVAAVFVGVLVHELGHAAAMRAYGRFCWITLYGFGGLTSSNFDGNYGERSSATLSQIITSVAGPAAGFALAAAVVLSIQLTGHRIEFAWGLPHGLQIAMERIGTELFTDFLYYVLVVSIYWGVLNLLPIYPLDGGQVAREVLLKFSPREGIARSLMLSVATAGGMAVVGLLVWRDLFVAILFGYLAWSSFATLQAYRRSW